MEPMEEEKKVRARIRANEQLAYEYETIGDLEGSLRCASRAQSLKSGLKRRQKSEK